MGGTIMNKHRNPNIPVTLLPHAELTPAPDREQQGQDSRVGEAWLSEIRGGGDPIQVVPTGG